MPTCCNGCDAEVWAPNRLFRRACREKMDAKIEAMCKPVCTPRSLAEAIARGGAPDSERTKIAAAVERLTKEARFMFDHLEEDDFPNSYPEIKAAVEAVERWEP
jgi:hypothetical protein